MVTGGHDGYLLSSTEIYVQSAWSYAASLPSPRRFLSASTVDNSVFVFGNVFKFSSQTETVTFVLKEDMMVMKLTWISGHIMTRSSDMIQSGTHGQLRGG